MNCLPIDEAFLQQIESLQMLVKNNVAGLFGGNHLSKTFGSSCEFADYRDYMAGDDIKKIDWNAYARFDKLYYKLYYDERQVHTRIYIDASRSMAHGRGGKDEQAVRVAATLAYLSVCAMDKVSVYIVHGDRVEELIVNLFGKDRFYEEISKLNEITFDGDSRLSEAITPTKVGYGDGTSIVISDFLSDADFKYDEETPSANFVDYLVSKKRDTFCVQILSKEELNPKVRGKMRLFDSEDLGVSYQEHINRNIIRAYKQALEAATGKVRDYCLARGAEYLLVSAEDSMHEIFFGRLVDKGVIK